MLALTGFMAIVLASLIGLTITGFTTTSPVRKDRRVNYALTSALDSAVQQARKEPPIGRQGYCPSQKLDVDGYTITVACQVVPQSCLFYDRSLFYVATASDPAATKAYVQVRLTDDFLNPTVPLTDIGVVSFSTTGAVTAPTTTTCSGGGGPANQPPTANFTFTVTNQTVAFNGSSSTDPDGSIASYAWDFGDASTGTGATPSHAYALPGTYSVTLTVTDNGGVTHSKTVDVTVLPPATQPPVASFTLSTSNLTALFNASASSDPDGTIAAYAWNFGDGSAAGTGVNPSHAYSAAGTYSVTLTVTDNLGATGTKTQSVTVFAPATKVLSFWRETDTMTVANGGRWSASATLAITDQNNPGQPRAGVQVAVTLRRCKKLASQCDSGTLGSWTLTTGANGEVSTPLVEIGSPNPYDYAQFTITNVTNTGGLTWDQANSEKILDVKSP